MSELCFAPYITSRSNAPSKERITDAQLETVRRLDSLLLDTIEHDEYVASFLLRVERPSGEVYFRPIPPVFQAIIAERLTDHCRRTSKTLAVLDLKVSFSASGWRILFGIL